MRQAKNKLQAEKTFKCIKRSKIKQVPLAKPEGRMLGKGSSIEHMLTYFCSPCEILLKHLTFISPNLN